MARPSEEPLAEWCSGPVPANAAVAQSSLARILSGLICGLALAACQSTKVSFPNAALSAGESAREIQGFLAKPEGSGPFPAVVLLHTCGGVQPHVLVDWPAYLVSIGYVALTVDPYGSAMRYEASATKRSKELVRDFLVRHLGK